MAMLCADVLNRQLLRPTIGDFMLIADEFPPRHTRLRREPLIGPRNVLIRDWTRLLRCGLAPEPRHTVAVPGKTNDHR